VVVVLGDRIEAMAGALAGVTTGKIVAHLHGGDVAPGDFDNLLRDAITKLAHLHFAATPEARRRIIRMGEKPSRVFCVGPPGLDRFKELIKQRPPLKRSSGWALVLHHPCGRSAKVERRIMNSLLTAVQQAGLRRWIIHPNSDRGHEGILQAIRHHERHAAPGAVRVVRSLDRDEYLVKLMEADVLVGNSSSGILEAPAAGTPVVNVGDRQQGRERSAQWVVDAEESAASILAAIHKALRKRGRPTASRLFGDGWAGWRIAERLASIPLNEALRRKQRATPPEPVG
jgi:UDP-hydrolysing UDP-N-acetyl-D-glucosamine 2-epimerase